LLSARVTFSSTVYDLGFLLDSQLTTKTTNYRRPISKAQHLAMTLRLLPVISAVLLYVRRRLFSTHFMDFIEKRTHAEFHVHELLMQSNSVLSNLHLTKLITTLCC